MCGLCAQEYIEAAISEDKAEPKVLPGRSPRRLFNWVTVALLAAWISLFGVVATVTEADTRTSEEFIQAMLK